jgi:hypothetical protein
VLAAAEDALDLVLGREQLGVPGDGLRDAEEQEAARAQRVVEQRDHLLLQPPAEVDQQVAAGDEVEAGERRVADQAVRREDAQVAQLLRRA